MKHLLFLLFIFAAVTAVSCGDSDSSVPLCNCEPDEYCIDDECHPTDATIAPAPDET